STAITVSSRTFRPRACGASPKPCGGSSAVPGDLGAPAALRETLEDLRAENRWMWDRMSEADRLSLARRRAHRVRESTISLSHWQESTQFVSLSVEDALGEVWRRIAGTPES